jgi:serine phosphatase RsbU (regulator of sigma subunit)
MIIIASIQFAKTPMQELAGLQMMGQNYNELLRASALTLLIVITFSIYIEVLKSTLFEKNAIAAEMAVARQIQSKLVPEISFRDATIEVYGMMQSASAVGGDYIDFIHQNDGHKTLAIADVSGHSVASGLLMSMLKTAFHTELKYAPSLQELMVSLNHTIYANKK